MKLQKFEPLTFYSNYKMLTTRPTRYINYCVANYNDNTILSTRLQCMPCPMPCSVSAGEEHGTSGGGCVGWLGGLGCILLGLGYNWESCASLFPFPSEVAASSARSREDGQRHNNSCLPRPPLQLPRSLRFGVPRQPPRWQDEDPADAAFAAARARSSKEGTATATRTARRTPDSFAGQWRRTPKRKEPPPEFPSPPAPRAACSRSWVWAGRRRSGARKEARLVRSATARAPRRSRPR